jgi:hypothetical protein
MSFNPNFRNPSQSRPMSSQQRQIEYARHVGTLQAEEYYRRRRGSRAEKADRASSCVNCDMPMGAGNAYCTSCGVYSQPLPSARHSVARPGSAKKRIMITILIVVTVLTLGAVLQAHSTSVTPNGTPGMSGGTTGASAGTTGVIITGANIRTGPGTENSIAAIAPAGTRIVIRCMIATSEGYWDELTSPYRGLWVGASLVQSDRPAPC